MAHLLSIYLTNWLTHCCTPYIIDSLSSINTRQRERQTESALISALISFEWRHSSVWVTFSLAALHGFGRCVSSLNIPLASVGRPHRLKPSSEGLGLSPGPWGASQRGMPTGPNASGLRPCDWTHLKNGLVPYSYAGGAYDKYSTNHCDTITRDTICVVDG